jgi:hypothetical protein
MSSHRKLTESEKKIIACSQKWNCGKCNNILPSSYQVDHIVPWSITNNDNFENLVALCPTCHASKTQVENKRILQFKKKRAKEGNICWFCLKICDNKCNKVIKKIEQDPMPSLIKAFENFYYTGTCGSQIQTSNIKEDTILRICLCNGYIYVNNFFTNTKTYSLQEISNAVFIATRTKKDSKKYTEVEITISIEDNTPDSLIEHINNNLPYMLTQRIFKPHVNIEYTYIVD